MTADAAQVHRTVEYRRDKWRMEKVPLALLLCLGGLAFVAFVDPKPPGFALLFLLSAMLVIGIAAAVLQWVWERIVERLPALLVGMLLVVALFAVFASGAPRRRPLRNIDGMPVSAIGWILVLLGLAWIAYALYRHLVPAKPMLVLSPAGLLYNAVGLKDLLIPWRVMEGIDALQVMGPSGYPVRDEDLTVVLLPQDYYERHILPRRSVLSGSGWDFIFRPRGTSMQMVLHPQLFAIHPRHIRAPVKARWQAFHGPASTSAPSVGGPLTNPPELYGVWSIDGSLWQATTFLVPLAGIAAVAVVLATRLR